MLFVFGEKGWINLKKRKAELDFRLHAIQKGRQSIKAGRAGGTL
jgi:hypothetical protein